MVFSGTVEEFDNYIQPNTLVVSLGTLPLVADIQALPGVVRVEELGWPEVPYSIFRCQGGNK